MSFIEQIRNFNELPKGGIWISIQNGKADHYRNHSPFAERERVLVFATDEQADYFINHWDSKLMNNYKEACLKQDYTFWVIFKTPNGYYADDIHMSGGE